MSSPIKFYITSRPKVFNNCYHSFKTLIDVSLFLFILLIFSPVTVHCQLSFHSNHSTTNHLAVFAPESSSRHQNAFEAKDKIIEETEMDQSNADRSYVLNHSKHDLFHSYFPLIEILRPYFTVVKFLASKLDSNSTTQTIGHSHVQPSNSTDERNTSIHHYTNHSHKISPTSTEAIWYWFISGMLVLFAGFASGLTVGLMSLDPLQLKVLETEGTPEQKRRYV